MDTRCSRDGRRNQEVYPRGLHISMPNKRKDILQKGSMRQNRTTAIIQAVEYIAENESIAKMFR